MLRTKPAVLCASFALLAATSAPTNVRPHAAPAPTREIIAVYIGAEGTDGGMANFVRDMHTALTTQASASGVRLVMRGVSIEPSVDGGIRHLARLGAFDEVSVGGNWGNSAVVRYLGGVTRDSTRSVPQVILLERTIREDSQAMEYGPEREVGRYMGVDGIIGWVRRGAPMPR